jgi:hypothetical protein
VIDSRLAGRDASEVLGGDPCEIPIFASLAEAIKKAADRPTHLVIGLATEGGRLPYIYRNLVIEALRIGMNVDSGLHQFLSDDPELSKQPSSDFYRSANRGVERFVLLDDRVRRRSTSERLSTCKIDRAATFTQPRFEKNNVVGFSALDSHFEMRESMPGGASCASL